MSLTSLHHAHGADDGCAFDFVLVGDSVGMVLHGLPSTLGVTMEMMILHGQAVARGSETSDVGGGYAVWLLRTKPRAGLSPMPPV